MDLEYSSFGGAILVTQANSKHRKERQQMNIRNRDIPGVVWVLLLVVGVYLLEHFLPGNYMAEGVLGVVGAMLVVLKMGLTMEEKRLVGEFEEGLKSEPERMSAPARRLYDVEVKSGSIRKLLLG